MSVASNANTSILLRMLSSRSTRSRPETAGSPGVTRAPLETRLVRGGTVHRGNRSAVEPQVHGELAAMVHEMIEHAAAVHGELRIGGDGPAADLERPGFLELRIRGGRDGGARRGRVAVEQLANTHRALERLELGRGTAPRHEVEPVARN